MTITSLIPWDARRLREYPIRGTWATGTRGFGTSSVIGFKRVPKPAAKINPFTTAATVSLERVLIQSSYLLLIRTIVKKN